jgi:hypothetical protein
MGKLKLYLPLMFCYFFDALTTTSTPPFVGGPIGDVYYFLSPSIARGGPCWFLVTMATGCAVMYT